jgi:hypothetical protein
VSPNPLVTPSGPNFIYTYFVSLTAGALQDTNPFTGLPANGQQNVGSETGSFFTIYNVFGFLGGLTVTGQNGTTWTAVATTPGITPSQQNTFDNPGNTNVVVYYNSGASPVPPSQVFQVSFLDSRPLSPTKTTRVNWQTWDTPVSGGTAQQGTFLTFGPNPSIPEPASFVLLGMGLPLGLLLFRRGRKTA